MFSFTLFFIVFFFKIIIQYATTVFFPAIQKGKLLLAKMAFPYAIMHYEILQISICTCK